MICSVSTVGFALICIEELRHPRLHSEVDGGENSVGIVLICIEGLRRAECRNRDRSSYVGRNCPDLY